MEELYLIWNNEIPLIHHLKALDELIKYICITHKSYWVELRHHGMAAN